MATLEADPCGGDWSINFKGVHNFENLYKMMYEFLTQRQFKHPAGDANIEEYYGETMLAGGEMKNCWIWWRTVKNANDMFDYHLDINVQILTLKTIEVMHNDRKVKTHDGEITITIKSNVVFDKDEKIKKHWLTSSLWNMFNRNHYYKLIDQNKDDLYSVKNDLYERIKQYLGLQLLSGRDPAFHPEGGLPQFES